MADIMNLDGADWEGGFDDVLGEVPEYVKLLVILVDCSGSLEGTLIGSVNSLMEEILADLERASGDRRIIVATYGDSVSWSSSAPQTLEDFGGWRRVHAGGMSNLGEALKQLSVKLKDKDWYPKGTIGTKEVFLLFSDGMATDHYEDGMELLKKNEVFKRGIRLAVNFSELSDTKVLEDFAGGSGGVLNLKRNEITKAQKRIVDVVNG